MSPRMTTIEDTTFIFKFDGTNFHLWKLKIQMILKELDLWSIIEGTEARPTVQDNPEEFSTQLSAWQKKNAKFIC